MFHYRKAMPSDWRATMDGSREAWYQQSATSHQSTPKISLRPSSMLGARWKPINVKIAIALIQRPMPCLNAPWHGSRLWRIIRACYLLRMPEPSQATLHWTALKTTKDTIRRIKATRFSKMNSTSHWSKTLRCTSWALVEWKMWSHQFRSQFQWMDYKNYAQF